LAGRYINITLENHLCRYGKRGSAYLRLYAKSKSVFWVTFGGLIMRRFHCAALAAVAVFGIASMAFAADLPIKAPVYKAPVAASPVFAWTGCYLGANIGGAWAKKSFSNSLTLPDDGGHTANGIIGGGQAGCDYQFASNWVIGIQGMLDGAHLTGSNTSPDDPDGTFSTRVKWFGTVTGRLGFLVTPSFLIYGKGGVAFVGENQSQDSIEGLFPPVAIHGSTGDFARTGWDAGAGLEWMFAPSWSVWLEYDHMGFGSTSETFAFADGSSFQENVKQSVDKVLVGVNYRFGLGNGGTLFVAR
jgi:outer membrane immunogenic protein